MCSRCNSIAILFDPQIIRLTHLRLKLIEYIDINTKINFQAIRIKTKLGCHFLTYFRWKILKTYFIQHYFYCAVRNSYICIMHKSITELLRTNFTIEIKCPRQDYICG